MTTNPKLEDQAANRGRTRFVMVTLGILVAAALVWILVGFLNGEKEPGANASESVPMQTDASDSSTGATGTSATEPTGEDTELGASDDPTQPVASEEGDPNTTEAAPITEFEDAMSSDWPEGKTTGCSYVVDRLDTIQSDVEITGIEGMRKWLDAIDDLHGDASMRDHSSEFDAVKRTWSTALAAAEDPEGSAGKQTLKDGTAALHELKNGIDCK